MGKLYISTMEPSWGKFRAGSSLPATEIAMGLLKLNFALQSQRLMPSVGIGIRQPAFYLVPFREEYADIPHTVGFSFIAESLAFIRGSTPGGSSAVHAADPFYPYRTAGSVGNKFVCIIGDMVWLQEYPATS